VTVDLAQLAADAATMPQGDWLILITTIAGIVTTIIGFVVQLYRERRNRAWELEDRTLKAEALQQKTEQAAVALQKETQRTRDMLTRKIDENTQISVDAFREANAVNMKLARINAMIDGVRTQEQLEQVAEIVKDTKHVAEATKEDTGFIKDKLDHG
jgi:transcriptional regulator of heat shock response